MHLINTSSHWLRNNVLMTMMYTPIHYLLNAFTKNFPHIKNKSTTQDTENILKFLKPKNTCDCDEIPTNLLKISSVYITSPLNHICNISLSSGVFPQCLKFSVVKRLYKGEKYCIYIYRPVSIMTSFCKVLEKVMYNRLLRHLNDKNVSVEEQSGCRKI